MPLTKYMHQYIRPENEPQNECVSPSCSPRKDGNSSSSSRCHRHCRSSLRDADSVGVNQCYFPGRVLTIQCSSGHHLSATCCSVSVATVSLRSLACMLASCVSTSCSTSWLWDMPEQHQQTFNTAWFYGNFFIVSESKRPTWRNNTHSVAPLVAKA